MSIRITLQIMQKGQKISLDYCNKIRFLVTKKYEILTLVPKKVKVQVLDKLQKLNMSS